MHDPAEHPLRAQPVARGLVLDTNVVLDLFVFLDPRAQAVAAASLSPAWRWIASRPMRDELERVLTYVHILTHMNSSGIRADHVLAQYDARTHSALCAPRCSAICKDPDDQIFIDMAVQHGTVLVSKDKAVLALKRKLAGLGVHALSAHEFTI